MTKADVITAIINKTGLDKEQTREIVAQLFQVIALSLENGEDVFIRDFGTFLVKKRNKTKGRHILRNTIIIIPEHYIPAFKPAVEFKEEVKARMAYKQALQAVI